MTAGERIPAASTSAAIVARVPVTLRWAAVVPDWALRPDGTTYDGVGAVKTLVDGSAWADRFAGAADGARVVVVGAGYIGVEVAEAALRVWALAQTAERVNAPLWERLRALGIVAGEA